MKNKILNYTKKQLIDLKNGIGLESLTSEERDVLATILKSRTVSLFLSNEGINVFDLVKDDFRIYVYKNRNVLCPMFLQDFNNKMISMETRREWARAGVLESLEVIIKASKEIADNILSKNVNYLTNFKSEENETLKSYIERASIVFDSKDANSKNKLYELLIKNCLKKN